MATPTYLSEECPNCGTAALVSELASGEGAPVFGKSSEVKAGQRVARCDACGEVIRAAAPSSGKKKPAAKKAASSKRKGSSSRRPQASKRARKRSSSSRK